MAKIGDIYKLIVPQSLYKNDLYKITQIGTYDRYYGTNLTHNFHNVYMSLEPTAWELVSEEPMFKVITEVKSRLELIDET